LLADDHSSAPIVSELGEGAAALARRHEVRPRVTEGGETAIAGQSRETAKPAAGDVLEEDTLDRILGAKREDFVELGLLQRGHAAIVHEKRARH
jgi:hypothetical protein